MQHRLHGMSDVLALQRSIVAFQDMIRNLRFPYPSEYSDFVDAEYGSSEQGLVGGSDLVGFNSGQHVQFYDIEEPVFVFPSGWTDGMQRLYLALQGSASSERYVSEDRLKWWTGLSSLEIREDLCRLGEAGRVHSMENGSMWAINEQTALELFGL